MRYRSEQFRKQICTTDEEGFRQPSSNKRLGKVIQFGNISSITSEDETTWRDKVFLTIDIDWAADFVLKDVIEVCEKFDVEATWFVTHETPLLERLRENPKFELGIHPNFEKLLWNAEMDHGGGYNASADKILTSILNFVPEANSVRSHRMTQGTRLLASFAAQGLTHDVNQFLPHQFIDDIRPWPCFTGILRVPYCWEDDVAIAYGDIQKNSVAKILKRKDLKVLDFHPIHIYLNTEDLRRYEDTRHVHHDSKELLKYRYGGYGTRNRFIELLELLQHP